MLQTIEASRPKAQTLRDYQQEAVEKLERSLASGNTPLVYAGTGAGKTTIIAEHAVRNFNPATQRILMFAETQEIVEQLYARVRNQYGDLLEHYYGPTFVQGIGMLMEGYTQINARILCATFQSLTPKRLDEVLSYGQFDLVVIDEADHVSADNSYMRIVNTIRQHNPAVLIYGVTATPKRTDRKGLGVLFNDICFKWPMRRGIETGYLAQPIRRRILTEVDLEGVGRSNNELNELDYNQEQLASVLEASNWVDLAVEAYLKYGENRPTLAFFPKIEMSKQFVHKMQAAGIKAAHVDGTTDKKLRRDILRKYSAGEIQVVSNMAVFTRGFDAPHTSCVLWARITSSEVLYTQAVGRGARLHVGKKNFLILELSARNVHVLDVGTLLGEMAECRVCHTECWKGTTHCPECGAEIGDTQPKTKLCKQCGEQMPIQAKKCPHCGHVPLKLAKEKPNQVMGSGLIAQYADLFSDMASSWQPDSAGWFSVPVGFDGSALVIAPPTYAGNGDRLKERIRTGWALYPQLDSATQAELQRQIDQLDRELSRIDQHSLYYAPPVPKDPITNRDQEWNAPPIAWLRSNADVAALMQEADAEAKLYGGYASDKNAGWRNRLASPGQRSYLNRLGYKKAELPATLTSGEAAGMITHKKAAARVSKFIQSDVLPEAK